MYIVGPSGIDWEHARAVLCACTRAAVDVLYIVHCTCRVSRPLRLRVSIFKAIEVEGT